ncbi:MAG: DUF1801 domain-containing protein [Pseudomonadales bacterium]
MPANSKDTGTFADLLRDCAPEVQALAEQLRTAILAIHPESTVVVRLGDRAATFGVGPKKMSEGYCYIMPLKDRVNLGFYQGSSLSDPTGLLEGTGKSLRHVKVHSMKIAKSTPLKTLITVSYRERSEALGK